MATHKQKRVSQIKRETETTDGARSQQHPFIDDQASEDLEMAEARLEEKKRLKRESPDKGKKAHRRDSSADDDEEDEEDENSNDSEMADFIVDDDEEVEEAAEYDPKDKKHKKKRRAPEIKPLDEEDLEVIRENVGMDLKKKSRLKRTAALENSPDSKPAVKKEEMIDTMPQKSQSYRIKEDEDVEPPIVKRYQSTEEVRQKAHADNQHRKKTQEIFADQKEKVVTKSDSKSEVSVIQKEFFNSDEIDDPYNTQADLKIAETDIPERLQTKLEGRLLQESPETTFELKVEAQWILDRITSTCDNQKQLLQAKDASEKIYKVLDLIRVKYLDIPMICKYRRYEFEPELNEDTVWLVHNFDIEYGKFQRAQSQVSDFLQKIQSFEPRVKSYLDELTYAKTLSDLSNFNALIRFLRHKYDDFLNEKDLKRKQPQRKDEIQIARQNKIPEFIKFCFLESGQYQENLQAKKLAHEPPEPKVSPLTICSDYVNDVYQKPLDLLQTVCFYAAVELSSQPYIRNMVKQTIRLNGQITCKLTEQGKKELDLFHPSYRLKLIQDEPLEKLRNTDVYLDIQQCEKVGLLESSIGLRDSKLADLQKFFYETYMVDSQHLTPWNKMRIEVINLLLGKFNEKNVWEAGMLMKELIKEVKEEIQAEAETCVINKCKLEYYKLLMTGPFSVPQNIVQEPSNKKKQDEIIKPKDRMCVLGTLMHQIDANNYIVTVAIVDKFGELQYHKDFMRLLPPRKKRQNQQDMRQDVHMQGDQRVPETEEEKDHKRDKETLINELRRHSVDLIVVAANSLESRKLYDVMFDLSGEAKNNQENFKKEASVIWGRTEVPKLFSLSHNSQRLHKNVPQILKQAISLARFEQDPLTEVLNLWSPITAENQALALNLDPMQKLVNQAKLAEGLEDENIRAVNNVGVDLNLVFDHEHMHSCLQFLSGLGPRMAKRALIKFKNIGKKLSTRGEMLKSNLFSFKVYFSVVPFVLIRIPIEAFHDKDSKIVHKFDILDQTRIHHEHYKLAMKIATDAYLYSENVDSNVVDKTEQNRHCKEVIAHPNLVNNLDIKAYNTQLEMTGQGNMKIVIQHICDEFQSPFKDPRSSRNQNNLLSNEQLFYLLIDETKRTFKSGQIVTATVSKVIGDSRVICRLENGLTGIIPKSKLMVVDGEKKLETDIQPGFIVTGRIDGINFQAKKERGGDPFEVELNCKQGDLTSHEKYKSILAAQHGIDERLIPAEDLKNLNFNADPNNKNQGRFIPRRIAHEKFKNISSKRAQAELAEAEVGDFVFRPSTRSEDHITLTWKFWAKQFVHIDIQEFDKPKGASIGSRLAISSESFENLREIVERYIIPCNRLVREVVRSPKWVDTDRWEVVEETLKSEKNADRSRIPYRFVILPQYQQHIVLAYLPKEKVVKEFIKVRPKGFYFHEQNLSPFMNLVNWFKENWQTKDYQRHLRRQKSPRPNVKVIPQIKETPGEMEDQANWQGAGGGSVHSYNGNQQQQQYSHVKTEQLKSYGRGSRAPRKDSPGQQWGDNRGMKQENQGGRSPGRWEGRDAQEYNYGQQNDALMSDAFEQTDRGFNNQRQQRPRPAGNGCHHCGQEGHFAKECPTKNNDARGGRPGGNGCHKCGQEGHFARECQNQPTNNGGGKSRDCYKCKQPGHMARNCPNDDVEDRGGYKRQRRDDNQNSFRGGQNEGWDQNQSNFGGQDAQRQQQDAWNTNQGSNSGWGQ